MLKSPFLKPLNRSEINQLDKLAVEQFGLPEAILMENAGRSVAEFLIENASKNESIIICCGGGNNGGDGFVIARYLFNHSLSVKVLLFCDAQKLQGSAKMHYDIIVKQGVEIIPISLDNFIHEEFHSIITNANWIVDALFGTGLKTPLRPPFDKIIEIINSAKTPAQFSSNNDTKSFNRTKKIISVDVPSGLDCDTGLPCGSTIRADITLTFAALKNGFLNPEAAQFLGEIFVLDIGIPINLFKM